MKLRLLLKKLVKTILWLAIILVFLFVIIAVLIQIPVVQNKIVRGITSYVSNKTHTEIEIRKIGISFPKSVVIEGLYLEDLKKDTLLYVGKASINIALYSLFHSKIAISSLAVENANLNLYSTKTDSLFNYNFLLTAFGDTTKQSKVATPTPSKWTFNIDQVSLKNVRFRYDDAYAGINVFAVLENSEFDVDEIDLQKSRYSVFDLLAAGLTANVRVCATKNKQNNRVGSVSPKITARSIRLSNSIVSYSDSVNYLSVDAVIVQSKLENPSIDLQKQLLITESLVLSKSKILYHTFAPKLVTTAIVATSGSNWKIALKNIDLEDNSLSYKSGNNLEIKNLFDVNNLEYHHLTLEADDFLYSTDLTKILVKKFSAIDQNNFPITGCEADFRMDQHSISARKLKVQTPYSTVDADVNLQYSSLSTLIDSMQFSNLDLDLRNLRFKNSDVLYFKPDLIIQPFFKNSQNITTASGKIGGQINNLDAKNLSVRTGANTRIETDFIIKGLPKVKTAFYDFPNLNIISGKKDILMMAGPYISDSMDIPENISMQVVFKGKMKSFESMANMSSSFGDANFVASIDPAENFSSKLSMSSFDIGRFLKDTLLYGPVTLTAQATGQGLDMNTIKAKIKADVTQIHLHKYTYHNLKMDGTVTGKEFEGKINLNDENAVFDFDGLVNLNPNMEHYKFQLNVKGADLQKLKLTNKDARVAFVAAADLQGGTVNKMNGTAGITNIIVASQGKTYVLDSFLSAAVNEPNNSEIKINSALIGIKYTGTVSPDALPGVLSQFINNYFPFTDTNRQSKKGGPANFSFEIQLHNHPILLDLLLPQLKEFEPGIIHGSFDSQKNDLKLNAAIKKIVYGTNEISDFTIDVNSDAKALNYKFSIGNISNSQINLDNVLFDGNVSANRILANISSTDGKNKKLQIRSQISKDRANYKLTLDPKEFYMVNNRWDIATDNYIELGKQGFLIHHLFINHADNQINIASVHDQFNDDLNIAIKNFRIDDISSIVEKNSSLVKGTVDGNILLKRVNNSYGLIADAKISNLTVHDIPIGNLTVKAENPSYEKFNIDVNLSGTDNNLTANGYFIPNGGNNSISIKTIIQSLSLRTVQAFSMGQLKEASGTLAGNISVEGKASAPDITGELVFSNAIIKPAFLNNSLELKHETIQLKKDGIYFNSFTMLDAGQHTATIDGSVQMKQLSDFIFALQVNTKDFLLFNTTVKDNKEFFGRMVIDSRINVNGPMKSAVVNAKVKMKKGSNFTFSVPEDKLTTDKGENVVEFDNSLKFNPILLRGEKKGGQSTGMTGFDLSSIIEIDKEATLRLLMDPSSTDSLVVKGEAALSFTMDRSGKMSLTGAYNLNEGSYLVSLESVIKKKFDIDAGSTIIWNGDPLDAEISINARYSVRAAPYDLVADQISGLSDIDKGGYKQRYPFLVILKLRGQILHPQISFSIQLPPEEKGILGGAVNQKLSMLNEDESALNKQVFALLVLGRFVQENPFQTESTGTSTLIRSTVGKFLSAQLNQLSSKILPGMELNFDIQSYDDYQSGVAKGRTQVEIGVKKQLFNERLSVQLGGAVDVEGDRAKQNSASDITSDVTVEYKLTKDGRFRMKGFRHNQYEGAIEGQLVETGVGVVFVRDFNRWDRLFKSQKNRSDSSKIQKSNVTINPK
ncbi:MAG: translocation/assembly module TamB domain-containing protein [Prolixibacteraceae bacterium]|nr:translocation/assembly module TamB domain-containing protein [Prolixibacteraceae bacterium]